VAAAGPRHGAELDKSVFAVVNVSDATRMIAEISSSRAREALNSRALSATDAAGVRPQQRPRGEREFQWHLLPMSIEKCRLVITEICRSAWRSG